jgi:hypothetical protein
LAHSQIERDGFEFVVQLNINEFTTKSDLGYMVSERK